MELYDIDDIRGEEPKGVDRWFQHMLLSIFSVRTSRSIYGTVINIIAFFAKVWLWITIPFVFFSFWKKSYREYLEESKSKTSHKQLNKYNGRNKV